MPDSKADKEIRIEFNTKMFNPSDLIVFWKNNKDHPEDQIVQLMKSISKYWVATPLIIDSKNVIIAWHGTREACIRLWMKEVPCDVRNDLTPKEARELRIYHNRISELGKRNKENLFFELSWLENNDLSDIFKWIDIFPKDSEDDSLVEKKQKKIWVFFLDIETMEKAKELLDANNIQYKI